MRSGQQVRYPAPRSRESPISPPKPSGARIHGQIVGTLAREVLGGTLAPGDALPNEDLLAARFEVSRSSMREAVKTLAAKGLIESRQRVGARIRPRVDWHMLDPDLLAWHPDILHDRPLMAGLLETRRIIEPAAAELAALRATARGLRRHRGLARRHGGRRAPHDLEACCEADLAFHGGIIAASRNVVLDGLVATHRGGAAGLAAGHQQRHRRPGALGRGASRRARRPAARATAPARGPP